MSDGRLPKTGRGSLVYGLVAFVLVFLALLPLQAPVDAAPPEIGSLAMMAGAFRPDILLVVTLGWLIRRPDQLPVLLLIGVFFTRDLITDAVPGLASLAMLAVSETVRARQNDLREAGFLLEWAMAAAMILAYALLQYVLAVALFIPRPPLMGVGLSVAGAILLYPVVIALLSWGLGLRRAAPGLVDETGQRI